MRVLVVVHQFLPKNVAGTEVYTYRMAQELRRRGHEVRLLFAEIDASRPQFETESGTFEGIPFTRMVYNYRIETFEESYRSARAEGVFVEVLERFRPDLVHIQHLDTFSLGLPYEARRRGLPVVYTLHEYALLCPAGGQFLLPSLERCEGPGPEECGRCLRNRPLADPKSAGVPEERVPAWEAERRAAAVLEMATHVTRFVSPSRYLRDVFVERGFPEDRFVVMDNGFDVAPFAGFRRTPSDAVRFGYVGAMVPHKGVHLLVEAFNHLGEGAWELHVFGAVRPDSPHAPYHERIRRLAADPRIRIRGGFPVDRVADVYSEIDVLVVPSVWVENSPLTIHEAFVVGAPVLTSNLGGMAELVEDGVSGLLFEVGDVASIRKTARRILDEPGLLDRLRGGIPEVKAMEEHGAELEAFYAGLRAEPLPKGKGAREAAWWRRWFRTAPR
jgi:glycosyltransferase involved in cell wall biosynthesis